MLVHKAWPEAHQASGHYSNADRKPLAALPILSKSLKPVFPGKGLSSLCLKTPKDGDFTVLSLLML